MIFEDDEKLETENYADKHWNNEERNVVIAENSGSFTENLERIAESVKDAVICISDQIRGLFRR